MIQKVMCPKCSKSFSADFSGYTSVFCPFCGRQLIIAIPVNESPSFKNNSIDKPMFYSVSIHLDKWTTNKTQAWLDYVSYHGEKPDDMPNSIWKRVSDDVKSVYKGTISNISKSFDGYNCVIKRKDGSYTIESPSENTMINGVITKEAWQNYKKARETQS